MSILRFDTELQLDAYRKRLESKLRPPVVGETSDNAAKAPTLAAPAVTDTASGTYSLTLPWPPSGNTAIRHVGKGGKHYRTAAYKEFIGRVRLIAHIKGLDGPRSAFLERLRLTLHAWAPDARARDLDNITKPTLDALQRAKVFVNDRQIDDLRVLRMPIDRKQPRVVVFIEPI